ncbi:hypothetical protein FSW04_24585 [Baekduia soli]|uniref:Uncharacterized protein n=1 Tax=Baekduia soli TaxID=496014 RepID=A0A5B8UBR4_9ACTN|nr:hypothetical protein [Baekduia soli]QEC50447.1 hypothetical protein FSW04_24585 [Baekduia soli]
MVFDGNAFALRVTVRCNAPAIGCRGELRAGGLDGSHLTARRDVSLRAGQSRRVFLRFTAEALDYGLRNAVDAGGAELTLAPRRGRSLRVLIGLRPVASCASGGETLASSRTIRVMRLTGFGDYGCLRPNGHPTRLTDGFERPIRISGQYVGGPVATGDGKYVSHGTAVAVFDVRARRRVRLRETAPTVTDLVLRPTGAVAWIERASDPGGWRVRALDDQGDRLLDAGPEIGPTFLQPLGAQEIAWTNGSERRAAPLR